MGIKFSKDIEWVEGPFEELKEPEGGWKKPCRIEDHTFRIEIEAGSFSLVCVDAHTEEQLLEMDPRGHTPGCQPDYEYLLCEFGPFKLEWQTDCPKRGYNDSGSHGVSCDCDHWLEPVRAESDHGRS